MCNQGNPQYHAPSPMTDLILPLSSSNRWHPSWGPPSPSPAGRRQLCPPLPGGDRCPRGAGAALGLSKQPHCFHLVALGCCGSVRVAPNRGCCATACAVGGSGWLGKHLCHGSKHPPFQLSPLPPARKINLGLSGNP